MKCYLCDSTSFNLIKKGVMDNNDISVLSCNICDLVFLDSFNHIDENFYENSNMHSTKVDISNWLKETEKDDNRRYLYLLEKIKNKKILDFGAGNGGFLFKAKEVANDVFGIEPEIQFKSFFKKNKLKILKSLEDLNDEKFDLITAFHVFEHLKDPLDILKNSPRPLKNVKMFHKLNKNETLYPKNVLVQLLNVFKNDVTNWVQEKREMN